MKVIFKPEAFKKFRSYILGIDYEISGFGKVEKIGENLFVTDVKIFPQVVSEAHTVLDAKALALFWDELMVQGEDIGLWKLWWHSHVEMQASFSQTDFNTIDEFDTELPEENWMLSIVANKMGNAFARIDIFQPIKCCINNVPWDVEVGDPELDIDIQKEIAEKVTIRPFHYVKKEVSQNMIDFLGKRTILPHKQTILSEAERKLLLEKFPPHMQSKLHFPTIEEGDII